MDPSLYKAAKYGKIEAFKETNDSDTQLNQLLTPDKNTVLHIHIRSSTNDETSFVEEILNLCPALLRQPNNSGDIPLHVAATYGHERIVKLLIARAKADHHDNDIERGEKAAKEMARARNSTKDTALHEAVRFGHVKVVRVLVEEDCSGLHEFYGANEDGETPLYVAAERKHGELVSVMLDMCTPPPVTDGPCGRTVLHAAVINNNNGKILEKMGHLTKKADDRGWVPLHFGAHLNYMPIVKDLLRWDKDAAYIKDLKGRTPLHLAASKGYHKMMSEILSCCPDCGELVDNRRRNALHFAMESNKYSAVKVILNDYSLSNLLNGKDIEGNTPLHVSTGHMYVLWALVFHPRMVDMMPFNKKNQTAHDLYLIKFGPHVSRFFKRLPVLLAGNRVLIYKDEDDPQEIEEQNDKDEDQKASSKFEKTRESTLVVATLIATITFAAGFTLPGGYVGSDEGPLRGTAILRQSHAFQAFMITDTMAMVLSSASVLIQLYINLHLVNKATRAKYQDRAHSLTTCSMIAMVIAFMTGTYAALAPSVALAAANCIICASFFFFFHKFTLYILD